jgi:hypothetical protein
MLVDVGTLIAGLAVMVTVAFEAPFIAMVAGGLAYRIFTLAVH